MMMDDEEYTVVLKTLKSPTNKRDPRSLKVAAVAAAMSEVVGGVDASAAKVYAATVSALEGTLKVERQSSPQEVLDSLSTQVALLELLRATVPHVANPAILDASLSLSSRVIRAIVDSSLAFDNQELQEIETNDELGGINAVLRAVCRVSTDLIRCLTPNCNAKFLKQFYFGTLIGLFEDHRPKVRKAAQHGINEIVLAEHCHPVIIKSTTHYSHNKLDRASKHVKKNEEPQAELLHLLALLERLVAKLDVTKLGKDLMELFVVLLQNGSSSRAQSEYVAVSTKDMTPRILTVISILSTIKELLESHSSNQTKAVDELSPRVLATLLQNEPSLVFTRGKADSDVLFRARALYGHVTITSCQRTTAVKPELAIKLLPVSIQVLLQLCRVTEEDVDEEVAAPIMTELAAFFRSGFQHLVSSSCPKSSLDECITNSLKAMEQVLLPAFQETWSVSLKALVILLQVVDTHDMVPDVIQALLTLRGESENINAQRSIDSAFGSLVESVGIQQFWLYVDWTGERKKPAKGSRSSTSVVNTAYSWLLPVMKTASTTAMGRRPNLEFFQKNVLDLARRCATALPSSTEKRVYDKWVLGLWSLFASFCQQPVDLAEQLEGLIPTLVKAMEDKRYPQLLGLVCFGLETLSIKLRERMDLEEGTLSERTQRESEAMSNATVLLLPVLFKNVERLYSSSATEGKVLDEMDIETTITEQTQVDANMTYRTTQAIATLTSHAPNQFLQKLFKKLMRRLLEESQSDSEDNNKLCSLLNLSQALVASRALDEISVSLMYRTIRPIIRNHEHGSRVQKMSYKVLAEICRCHHSFVTAEDTLSEFIDLLTAAALTSQVSARAMRLKCIGNVIDGFEDGAFDNQVAMTKMAGEIMLCLKDSKAKTRDAAYEVLISLANATGNLNDFVRLVIAALASETTHMRSAAVMAASRLVFEFAREDASFQDLLPSLLKTVLILFDEQSREVIKSAVGFVRVCVAAIDPDNLRPVLPDLVAALLKYQRGKDRFRAKIKIILKKLVRMYGYDTLMPLVPESESRLLTHMRKLDERAARRKAANRPDGSLERRNYDEMLASDEEDSDNGRTLMTGATGLTKQTERSQMSFKSAALSRASRSRASHASNRKPDMGPVRLFDESDGEVLNILSLKQKSVRFAEQEDGDSDDDGMMEFDDAGRLVVMDDEDDESVPMKGDVDGNDERSRQGNKRRRLGGANDNESTRSSKSDATRGKRGRDKSVRQLGSSYKSRKAGGDVKKKGQKFEPYAYVPLDGRTYSKKNRRRAVEQMATVVPQGGKRKRN